ncbi:MAG: DNA repair protein RecO C-terminal domain-containing protein [Spirochaetia bacterium]|nr:DNA repair protein RecO C-terminal domain-containing protein [Spirochaetia bacterium]
MSQRSLSYEAVILRARESPSGVRIVSLLSGDEGVVDAFVFGGPKSKLRSLVSPWHSGRAWLYRDPGRNFTTLRDFDVAEDFPGIRASLATIGAASLAAELVMATSAFGGDGPEARSLTLDLLRCLDGSDDDRAARALTLFCLRAVELMGLIPDPSECSACAGQIPFDTVHSYSRYSGAFLCPPCACQDVHPDAVLDVPPGALAWWRNSEGLDFAQAASAGLASQSLAAIKAVALDLAGKAAHGRLRTLESGVL